MADFFKHLFRFLVFHGGSGSTKEEINTAVQHGVVKMNVDTGAIFTHLLLLFPLTRVVDTQWAYLLGIRVRKLLPVVKDQLIVTQLAI